MTDEADNRKGLQLSFFAYTWWGLAPLYWAALNHVPAMDIVINRMLSAGPAIVIFLLFKGRLLATLRMIRCNRNILFVLCSGILISCNWSIFMVAINNGHIKQSSLGYFLSPLVNIVLAMLLFKERPNTAQWFSISIASIGIFYLILRLGEVPWYSIGLAVTWGFYSAARKMIPFSATEGNSIESILLFPMAILLIFLTGSNTSLGQYGLATDSMLLMAGTFTVIPLIAFVAASKLTTMTNLSLMFYLGPTLQLILAVWVFNEEVSHDDWIGFGCIAIALGIYSADLIRRYLKH